MTSIRKATFTSALLGALVALFAIGPGYLLAEPVPGSPGGGGRVTSTMLETGAVTTTAILDGTILTGDIAADTILAADIATGAVTTTEILDSTIVAGDIATGAVTTTGILDATVAYADVNATGTLAGNPANGASAVWFGTTGLIFEGSTSDTIEGLLVAADVSASDKTWTLPNTTGTLVTTGDSGTVTSAMLLDATVAAGDLATSALTTANVAGLANTASTLRARIVQKMTFSLVAADFGANDDIILTVPAGHNILITDATYTGATAEGGAATVTLYDTANGGGTAVTSALNMNDTAGNIQRTTKVVQSAAAFAAAASIYAHCSTNPGTAVGLLTIEYVHTN